MFRDRPRDRDERQLIGTIEGAETVEELQAALRDVSPDVVLEFHEEHCDGEGITVGEFAPRASA